MKIHKLMKTILLSLAILGFVASAALFWMLDSNQENGHVVNAAGMVRGAAQRISKLHLMDKSIDTLMQDTEQMMNGLLQGDPSMSLIKVSSPDFQQKVQQMQDYWNTELKQQLVHAPGQHNTQKLYEKSEQFFQLSDEVTAAAEEFASHKITHIKLFVVLILILNLISIIIIWLIVKRRILQPLSTLESGVAEVSKGNLSAEIEYASEDELGSLSDSMKYMVESLRNYISEIQYELSEISKGNLQIYTSSEFHGDFLAIKEALDNIISSLQNTVIGIHQSAARVANASSQMANGAQILAQSSVEQSTSMNALDTTVSQVSERIGNTASNAEYAGQMVAKVQEQIELCGVKMKEMVQAMDMISSSSVGIEKITKAIEDISFQTNILALNAAVEAARAGVAGKGFAVVADEVRALANRSSESVKNTAALVQDSQNAVKNGTEIVSQTASLLREVITLAQEVTGTVSSITSETAEQSASVADIMQNISQISDVVTSNSATTQESSAASMELAAEARVLENLVGHFKIADSVLEKEYT